MEIVSQNTTSEQDTLPLLLQLLTVQELKEVMKLSGLSVKTKKKSRNSIGEEITGREQLVEEILKHKKQRTLDGQPVVAKAIWKITGGIGYLEA
jgi:hypothetical protein